MSGLRGWVSRITQRPHIEDTDGHSMSGNCFHELVCRDCDECGAEMCDVCHDHEEERGECECCPRCPACG